MKMFAAPKSAPSWIPPMPVPTVSLTRDELRYILDPKEFHGDDFTGVPAFQKFLKKQVFHFLITNPP